MVKNNFRIKTISFRKTISLNWASFHFLFFIFALLITLNIFSPRHALSAEVTVRWDSSAQATGYKLHYGIESRSYDFTEDVGPSLQHTVTDLNDNQKYYFAVTAYNDYGESTFSAELDYETPPYSENQPPVVDAGADQAITLPEDGVFLNGTVTDDGLPGATTTAWSKVSGPGTVSFNDAANVDTWVSFSATGTYVLRLEADDGDLSADDEVTIIVHPGTANQAPVVDAGADQAITLPEDGVFLNGTVTDDGLPDPPGATTTAWTKVSGPGTVLFNDFAKVDTGVSFFDAGTYVLKLEADDDDLTVSDEVTITVNAPPPPAGAGPYLETGVVQEVDNSGWTTVELSRIYTSMVVVCTPNYDITSPAVIVRVDEAEGDSFRVRLDRTDGSTAPIDGVPIHYMVVEKGIYTEAEHGVKMEAVKFLSTVTDENNSWSGQSMPYSNFYANPVVLGQVMTYNDDRFSTFWSCGSSTNNPPDSFNFKVGKTISEDPDNDREHETIGYIVIEAGSGDIEGVQYAAALGNDSVKGVDNAPPYTYAPGALSAPEVAIASVAAMDGANGGWAILYGANPVTSGKLNLAIDEDQSADSERAHTSEQVAYIVFENSGDLPNPASQPSPANGATNVSKTPALSWTAGSGAISHDVYFGMDSSPPFIGSQTAATYDPGTLQEETTYYWRIDENGAQGTTPGIVWSFTTGSAPEPLWVQLSYDDFESGWGSYTDGGRDCSLYTRGTYAHQGDNAVNIQDNSGTQSSFVYTSSIDTDTPGFTQIEIDFWFKAISMDNSQEDFQVQYYDGSTWRTVATYAAEADFDNNVFYNKKVFIDESSYTFPTDMKIRFVCDASSDWDDVYIDEIRVSAK